LANGGNFSGTCCEGGGSGGGVRIDVGTISGSGAVRAHGGNGIDGGGGGGGGRIAIYYQNLTGFDLTNVTAFGGSGSNTPGNSNGGAGTIYLQGPSREVGELIVDNDNIQPSSQSTRLLKTSSGLIALANLLVRRGAKLRADGIINVIGTLQVSFNGEFMSSDRVIANLVDLTDGGVIAQIPTDSTA
jgi:hypothetical protein